MKTYVEILVEIPCFKCLFWNPIRDSHLHCNPNECQELTEWLLEQIENQEQTERSLVFASRRAKNSTKDMIKQI
jgi:hypothetical protein